MLLMNDHLETDIINGNGKAYGVEFMIKKQLGMLTGWISYTYSRVLLKVDGKFEEEKVNGGNISLQIMINQTILNLLPMQNSSEDLTLLQI